MISRRLTDAIGRLDECPTPIKAALAQQLGGPACAGAGSEADALPISIRLPRLRPEPGETWVEYSARAGGHADRFLEELDGRFADRFDVLASANAIRTCATPAEILRVAEMEAAELIELDDPLFVAATCAAIDASPDIGLDAFMRNHPGCGGAGIRVAVLDSGVDLAHPALDVAGSLSVCDEPDDVPGFHGTHCAGMIASCDGEHPGVAPRVELINVKVLDSLGRGRHTDVIRGIEAAIDSRADVISMSLGFNHLPAETARGHGWACTEANCVLCRAVETAVAFGHVVIASAGNEGIRSPALVRSRHHTRFATELTCPAHAPAAIAVGIAPPSNGRHLRPSSCGATAYGRLEPDLVAPGSNVWSTAPVPRRHGEPIAGETPRSRLFARVSGTPAATPVVAAAVALLIEERRMLGATVTPEDIRNDLVRHAVAPVPGLPDHVVGAGRLDLADF